MIPPSISAFPSCAFLHVPPSCSSSCSSSLSSVFGSSFPSSSSSSISPPFRSPFRPFRPVQRFKKTVKSRLLVPNRIRRSLLLPLPRIHRYVRSSQTQHKRTHGHISSGAVERHFTLQCDRVADGRCNWCSRCGRCRRSSRRRRSKRWLWYYRLSAVFHHRHRHLFALVAFYFFLLRPRFNRLPIRDCIRHIFFIRFCTFQNIRHNSLTFPTSLASPRTAPQDTDNLFPITPVTPAIPLLSPQPPIASRRPSHCPQSSLSALFSRPLATLTFFPSTPLSLLFPLRFPFSYKARPQRVPPPCLW